MLSLIAACTDDEETVSGGSSNEEQNLSANSIMTTVDNTFATLGEASSESFMSSDCENGQPATVNPGEATYASALYNCQMNTNAKSPDNHRGAYYLIKGIMCILENDNPEINYEEEGTINALTVSESDACWGSDGFDGIDEDGDTEDSMVVSIYHRPTSSESLFDFYVGIQEGSSHSGDESQDLIKIFYRSASTYVGFRVVDFQNYYEVNLTSNSIMWENYDFPTSSSDGRSKARHTRIMALGDFDLSSGENGELEEIYFAWSQGNELSYPSQDREAVVSYGSSSTGTFVQSFDHWNGTLNELISRAEGYSEVTEIPFNDAFLSFSNYDITETPETDPLLNLAPFTLE